MSLFNELNTNVSNRVNMVSNAAIVVANRIFNDLMIASFKEQSHKVSAVTDISFELVHYKAVYACGDEAFSWVDFSPVGKGFASAVQILLKACDDTSRSHVTDLIDFHIIQAAVCHGLVLKKQRGVQSTAFFVASKEAHNDLESQN